MKSDLPNDKKMSHDWTARICQFVIERTVLILTISFCIAMSVVYWHLHQMSSNMVRMTALQDVALYSEALAEFRTLYTSEVVSRAKKEGLEVTHDYEHNDRAIPLPATLSMKLGNRIGEHNSGAKTRLYSDHPFPWREDGGPHDEFEFAALLSLRKTPDKPYFRFENVDGRPSLRYATADLMRESCVSCHNSHADSPKTDWQVGDVRGVLEVVLPLDNNIAQAHASLHDTFILMIALGICGVVGLGLVFNRLRKSADETSDANKQLATANEDLERQKNELTDVLASLDEQYGEVTKAQAEAIRRATELEKARRAALNMMSDANTARRTAESAEDSVRQQAQELSRKNETLAKEINERKQAESDRERLHQELMDSSRKAGMAEMATGVLHNVGNVLNSVNVSANILVDRIRRGRVENLAKASEMVIDNIDNLADFVTIDDRGKHLPRYLSQLADHLISERDGALDELDSLLSNVEHIKQIVSVQQSYAQVSGIMEPIALSELTEDGLKVYEAGLASMHAEVIRNYDDDTLVTTDKHKVLQIIINLISNAKHALADSEVRPAKLTLDVLRTKNDSVQISVTDNGSGIDPDHLTRIFNHGFTTKREGHGFGLHASANAAQGLGGSLNVFSKGKGEGATFTLELPCVSPKMSDDEAKVSDQLASIS